MGPRGEENDVLSHCRMLEFMLLEVELWAVHRCSLLGLWGVGAEGVATPGRTICAHLESCGRLPRREGTKEARQGVGRGSHRACGWGVGVGVQV